MLGRKKRKIERKKKFKRKKIEMIEKFLDVVYYIRKKKKEFVKLQFNNFKYNILF